MKKTQIVSQLAGGGNGGRGEAMWTEGPGMCPAGDKGQLAKSRRQAF